MTCVGVVDALIGYEKERKVERVQVVMRNMGAEA